MPFDNDIPENDICDCAKSFQIYTHITVILVLRRRGLFWSNILISNVHYMTCNVMDIRKKYIRSHDMFHGKSFLLLRG